MKQLRSAKIFTLIFHGIIIIFAGHGIGIMGMLDVLFPYLLLKGEVDFDSFANLIPWAVLSSFLGKTIILISLYSIHKSWKFWLTILGLILLLLSFTSIVLSSEDSLVILSLLSGIPFISYTGLVLYLMYQSKIK